MTDVNKIIQCAAGKTLKTTYRKKTHKDNSIWEPLGITDKIKTNIKLRKLYNRQKRNATRG